MLEMEELWDVQVFPGSFLNVSQLKRRDELSCGPGSRHGKL